LKKNPLKIEKNKLQEEAKYNKKHNKKRLRKRHFKENSQKED